MLQEMQSASNPFDVDKKLKNTVYDMDIRCERSCKNESSC